MRWGGASRDRLARIGTGRGRATWSILDQGLSSFTNFGLAIVVARESSTQELGAFEILFSIYLFAVGCSRALSSEPLLVRHSDNTQREVEGPAARAMGAAFVVSIVAGLICLLIAPAFESEVRGPLIAFGVMMPGLLVQDAWRYVFFAAGRPAKAFVNDAIWTVVQFSLLGWLLLRERPGLTMLVLAWGVSALVGAVIGVVQAGILPRPSQVGIWWRDQRELAWRFLGEFTVGTGAAQLCIWLIGLVGGLKVLGALPRRSGPDRADADLPGRRSGGGDPRTGAAWATLADPTQPSRRSHVMGTCGARSLLGPGDPSPAEQRRREAARRELGAGPCSCCRS